MKYLPNVVFRLQLLDLYPLPRPFYILPECNRTFLRNDHHRGRTPFLVCDIECS